MSRVEGRGSRVEGVKKFKKLILHLHNAARALSSRSRCFQLSANLNKDFFRYL